MKEYLDRTKLKIKEFNDIVKLKVIDIDGYDYKLEKVNGEIIIKNIELYDNFKLELNNYIYISNITLKDNDMLQFGKIINGKNEIIKIVNDDKEFYLQRYYG